MRYYAIAKKWDDEKKAHVNTIIGEFTDYDCAFLFMTAYNAEHGSIRDCNGRYWYTRIYPENVVLNYDLP